MFYGSSASPAVRGILMLLHIQPTYKITRATQRHDVVVANKITNYNKPLCMQWESPNGQWRSKRIETSGREHSKVYERGRLRSSKVENSINVKLVRKRVFGKLLRGCKGMKTFQFLKIVEFSKCLNSKKIENQKFFSSLWKSTNLPLVNLYCHQVLH